MSRILENVLKDAKALHRSGGMSQVTMREIETLCVPKAKSLNAAEIVSLRKRLKVSQCVMADCINVSPESIRKWESGERKPSGASLRLLNVILDKGLEILR